MKLNIFPLQSELIDAVIGFANAKLREPADIKKYFKDTWQPDSLPKDMRTYMKLQNTVRNWLLGAKYGDSDHVLALHGIGSHGWPNVVDKGIELQGKIYLETATPASGPNDKIVWDWRISRASLRSICGLAVATICQEGWHLNVHECKRGGCENIFIDRHSRGKPRLYCQSTECANKRNSEAVRKSQKKARK